MGVHPEVMDAMHRAVIAVHVVEHSLVAAGLDRREVARYLEGAREAVEHARRLVSVECGVYPVDRERRVTRR